MKAALVSAPGKVEVVEVPDPAPARDEVVVAVAACGICRTDLLLVDDHSVSDPPIVPGHEFAGEVVAVGADVTAPRVGEQVAVDPTTRCGSCHDCRRGRGNLCEHRTVSGLTRDGGAAEYATAPARNCAVLPESVDPADAALVEPLALAVRGFEALPRRQGDHYLVYGAGTTGLLMAELAGHAGAASVSVVDPGAEARAAARELGCVAAAGAADLDGPRGWDVVIDCTGASAAIHDGLARVGRGGTFLQFGSSAHDVSVEIEPYRIRDREITITGSIGVLDGFDRAAELFGSGLVRAEVLTSHIYPLDRYAAAMAAFRSGGVRRAHLAPAVPDLRGRDVPAAESRTASSAPGSSTIWGYELERARRSGREVRLLG
ncbi:alcohol dehydrogenase catalytic domain-containing protein [Glycomyces xiaoerkulensis]|uniref:alcohol dehydrogenase catalytic domain-containing protein n=1 Tax=Glycomyces xiaoerkulensis TaxID=2038139 RepID=UPI000C255C65|nr:alcohol dehydrogenase catalytic domain-containing protein [Glycomyces xiaoerkulensis]